MFGRKKKPSQPQEGKKKNEIAAMLGLDMSPEDMADLGIGSIGIGDDGDDDEDDDDESLEAELAALQQGDSEPKVKRKKPVGRILGDNVMDDEDVGDDEEDDDEDVENNAELLAELQCIAPGDDGVECQDPTPVLVPSVPTTPNTQQEAKHSSSDLNVLLERESMYKQAIDNANKAGEGSKSRRYGRGLKEIEQMIKQVKAGKKVDMDAVPPPVAIKATQPSAPAPSFPVSTQSGPEVRDGTSTSDNKATKPDQGAAPFPSQANQQLTESKISSSDKTKTVELFTARRNEYRVAALTCKKHGEIQQAKQFFAISKQIDSAIEGLQNNEAVDISQLPPVPSLSATSTGNSSSANEQSTAPSADTQPSTASDHGSSGTGSAPKKLEPPPPPKDAAEALQQRLDKYQSAMDEAKKEGNSGKARRMGRIVKQYQDAIKTHKAGKPVAFDELPTPPGYAPIPGVSSSDDTAEESSPAGQASDPSSATTSQGPVPSAVSNAASLTGGSAAAQPALQTSASISKSPSRYEQQLNYLLERQKEFKMAAVQSKKQGDLEGAKNYLRMSKGLDKMILSAQNGLRVDLGTVPPSPFAAASPAPTTEMSFEMVQAEDCDPNPRTPEEISELFSRLEDALIKQIEMCARNAQHYQKLGDITNTKNFEKMSKNLRQDLDAVQSARKHQDPPPRFHYEDRSFTIVDSFPDLSDSEVEINIIRGLNVPLPSGYQPKDMDTYVSYEFPYPSADEPQTGRTQTVKHSINPEYNEVFKVNIDRKNRSLGRIFKRQPLKLEVKYERGFLKGDKTLGQVQVKLSSFDSKCEIHDCFDLMDTDRGRKAVGGKIEVHLRIREPLVDKDVKVEKWKWLVIDLHLTSKKAAALPREPVKVAPKAGKTARGPENTQTHFVSLEVVKLEKQMAEKQLAAQKSRGEVPSAAIIQRCKQCQQKIAEVERMLASGDRNLLTNYIRQLQERVPQEHAKAQQALRAGNKSEAQLCLAKKKLMENEISSLKSQLGIR
ncbi:coiled-coil and C2 domain-containing protein 1-like isoform X2 [Montipora capricornis]|uniref:coiled-coil and C2 domain-containing protein 1-like isoform X2 n=1 Tax=Montipora capricornis TaxID=246305 RepID=UPI0035F16914